MRHINAALEQDLQQQLLENTELEDFLQQLWMCTVFNTNSPLCNFVYGFRFFAFIPFCCDMSAPLPPPVQPHFSSLLCFYAFVQLTPSFYSCHTLRTQDLVWHFVSFYSVLFWSQPRFMLITASEPQLSRLFTLSLLPSQQPQPHPLLSHFFRLFYCVHMHNTSLLHQKNSLPFSPSQSPSLSQFGTKGTVHHIATLLAF